MSDSPKPDDGVMTWASFGSFFKIHTHPQRPAPLPSLITFLNASTAAVRDENAHLQNRLRNARYQHEVIAAQARKAGLSPLYRDRQAAEELQRRARLAAEAQRGAMPTSQKAPTPSPLPFLPSPSTSSMERGRPRGRPRGRGRGGLRETVLSHTATPASRPSSSDIDTPSPASASIAPPRTATPQNADAAITVQIPGYVLRSASQPLTP